MNFTTGVNSGNEVLFFMKEVLKYYKDMSLMLLTAYGLIDFMHVAEAVNYRNLDRDIWGGKKKKGRSPPASLTVSKKQTFTPC
jgi:hypothetical protein